MVPLATGNVGFGFRILLSKSGFGLDVVDERWIDARCGPHVARMPEHYSHVRMAAKRTALEKLENGLMVGPRQRVSPS